MPEQPDRVQPEPASDDEAEEVQVETRSVGIIGDTGRGQERRGAFGVLSLIIFFVLGGLVGAGLVYTDLSAQVKQAEAQAQLEGVRASWAVSGLAKGAELQVRRALDDANARNFAAAETSANDALKVLGAEQRLNQETPGMSNFAIKDLNAALEALGRNDQVQAVERLDRALDKIGQLRTPPSVESRTKRKHRAKAAAPAAIEKPAATEEPTTEPSAKAAAPSEPLRTVPRHPTKAAGADDVGAAVKGATE